MGHVFQDVNICSGRNLFLNTSPWHEISLLAQFLLENWICFQMFQLFISVYASVPLPFSLICSVVVGFLFCFGFCFGTTLNFFQPYFWLFAQGSLWLDLGDHLQYWGPNSGQLCVRQVPHQPSYLPLERTYMQSHHHTWLYVKELPYRLIKWQLRNFTFG